VGRRVVVVRPVRQQLSSSSIVKAIKFTFDAMLLVSYLTLSSPSLLNFYYQMIVLSVAIVIRMKKMRVQ
jgi:hypothetical protein